MTTLKINVKNKSLSIITQDNEVYQYDLTLSVVMLNVKLVSLLCSVLLC